MFENSFHRAISSKSYPGTGVPDSVIKKFVDLWVPAKRIGFYPSSGTDLRRVFELDCNAFFFANYSSSKTKDFYKKAIAESIPKIQFIEINREFIVFSRGSKRGYFFMIDNNEVLQLMEKCNLRLNLFVGMRDGCMEGGNYECTNTIPFLEKIISLSSDVGMDVYVDHSAFLHMYSNYIFGNRYIHFIEESTSQFNRHPIDSVQHYYVSLHKPEIWKWEKRNIKLTIEFDSILNHVSDLDYSVCRGLCTGFLMYKFREELNRKILKFPRRFFQPEFEIGWSGSDSLEMLLDRISHISCKIIGTTAFGQGQHQEYLSILGNTVIQKPLWLRFFHVDIDDFSGLKKMMNRIG